MVLMIIELGLNQGFQLLAVAVGEVLLLNSLLSTLSTSAIFMVFEETLQNGEKLTDAINRTNENVKYLPGIKLGKNVIADPDLDNAVGRRKRKRKLPRHLLRMEEKDNLMSLRLRCCRARNYSLRHRGLLELFPLFATVHKICSGCLPPSAIVIYSEKKPRLPV
ncbi:hypothetical protein CXB51_003802 [Gossypium anomalum]|uniref:Glycerol-3-phosphate dehydrogenase NAD-dependent N-terminal domain-containing protein n=1 Tax=Gossypium anomalum TaxID=47600 RepID=A0A8J5ZPR9_9ROSI|nr:hypothetical protein CXB51_003802 [Gossypium anomalum]